MKNLTKLSFASMLALTFIAGPAEAAAPLQVMVNGSNSDSEHAAYLQNGTTMVPLNVVQKLPEVSIAWDNVRKAVTISKGSVTTVLVAGQKTAAQGNKKLSLPIASTLKQGRVMVPLRFVAEVSGAYVGWNAHTHTVYVSKASTRLQQKLNSPILPEARSAALALPAVTLLKNIQPTPATLEGLSFHYYFPEGISNRFFVEAGDILAYFEIVNGRSQEIWRARLDLSSRSANSLFFSPYRILEEDGQRPTITGRVVFYHVMTHTGSADYGFVETNGTRTTLGTKAISMNAVFEIPEEKH